MQLNKEKIEASLRSMDALLDSLIKRFEVGRIQNNLKILQITKSVKMDDNPQDFYAIDVNKNRAYLQMIKPGFSPCFYFKKQDIHTFTSDIQEVYQFLVEIDNKKLIK